MAAKKVPKKELMGPPAPPLKKPSADARAFGASTAIFVPPELQHEQGPKRPTRPTSVVSRVPQRTESISEKKARLARETHARERLRIGRHITSATGANRLDAVPVYHPPPSRRIHPLGGLLSVPRFIPGTHIEWSDAGRGAASAAEAALHVPASLLIPNPAGLDPRRAPKEYKASDLPAAKMAKALGGVAAEGILPFAQFLTPNPAGLARPDRAPKEFTPSDLKKQAKAMSTQVIGKSLTNILAEGDTPNSAMDAAGLGVGVLGILPFGKITELAKFGKALEVAGKAGEALPMTPAREATYKALAQRYGVEKADNVILATDNIARQAAASKADSVAHIVEPNDWYEHTPIKATNYGDYTPTAGSKTQFQTAAGPRSGLVEGASKWVDHPSGDFIPGAGDHVRFQSHGGGVGLIEDIKGTTATLKLENGKTVDSWVGDLVPVIPDTSKEVPVFYSPLQRKVAEQIPPEGLTKTETIKTLAPNKKPTSTKEAEWMDSGTKDFLDQYGANEVVPKADLQQHFASSLNAYDLDEIIRSSDSAQFQAKWGDAFGGGRLIVKEPSKAEPYYEIAMKLRTPLRERVKKTAAGLLRVTTPYGGTGLTHWGQGDVVGHVRFHIITDTEGKKALLVEEIQSDWASQYREFVAAGGNEGIDQRVERIRRELEILAQDLDEARFGSGDQGLVDEGIIEEEISKLQAESKHLQKLKDDVVTGAPPLGKKQMEAIVRRTIRFAHDANVDRIIVTPGDVQAIRNTAFAKTPRGRAINLTNHALPIEEQSNQAATWSVDVAGMTHEEIKAYALAHKDSGAAATFFRLYDRDIPAMFAKEMGEKSTPTEGIFKGRYSDGPGALPRHGSYPMDGHVIEMTPAAKAKAAEPMSLYQQRAWEDVPKGATEFFADGTRAIHLFEDADISTVLHELAHVGYADMSEVDQAILGRHFNDFKTTADHEMYARSFERYIYEGHAMTSELDGVFGKLRTWMHGVYSHVNQIGAVVNPEVARVFDRMVVQQESPEAQLVRMLKSAPKVRKAQAAGYSVERGKRIEQMFDQWPEDASIEEVHSAMSALKGELPKEPFTGLDELAPEAVASIVKSIRMSPRVRRFEKVRAFKAVIKATEGGVPTDSEIVLLNKIFNGNVHFAKEQMGRIERVFVEVWNIPRSLAASFDLSAPLRQGFIAGTRHPVVFSKAFKPMFEALFSAKRAEEIAAEIASRENYVHYGRGNLAVETSATSADLAQREEQFYSSYAEKFWPVKWSGRAYEAFLHRLRADIFDLTMEAGRAAGRPVESDEFVEGLGRMVNQMTGRGAMPDIHLLPLETAAPLLNTFLFSPRLLASRVNMISPAYYYKLAKSDPFLFAEATKNLATTVLSVGVVLGTVTAIGTQTGIPISVGWDPTSANFGKIRVGDTRIDIMAGFSPLLVFLCREVLGKSTSSTTGKTQNLEGGFGKSSRLDIAFRFAQSKAAPSTSVILDWMRNQTFVGDPVTPLGEIKNSASPMMLRDVLDAWRSPKDPVDAVVAGGTALALGTFGIGVSTYAAKKKKAKTRTKPDKNDPYAPDLGSVGADLYAPDTSSGGADLYAPGP